MAALQHERSTCGAEEISAERPSRTAQWIDGNWVASHATMPVVCAATGKQIGEIGRGDGARRAFGLHRARPLVWWRRPSAVLCDDAFSLRRPILMSQPPSWTRPSRRRSVPSARARGPGRANSPPAVRECFGEWRTKSRRGAWSWPRWRRSTAASPSLRPCATWTTWPARSATTQASPYCRWAGVGLPARSKNSGRFTPPACTIDRANSLTHA